MPEKEGMPQEKIVAQNEQILIPQEASVKNDLPPRYLEQPLSVPAVAEIIQKDPLILPPPPKPPAATPRPAAPNGASKEKQKEAVKKTEQKKPPEKKPLAKKPPEKNEPKQERKKTTLELEAGKKREIEKLEIQKKQTEKKQFEQTEKIRKQIEKEETEKKRLQQIAETEKKRQAEIAEQEMRRQKEIAAAQEAAKQKVQAHLSKAKENLAKIGETRDKITSNSSINLEAAPIPKELGLLQVDALPSERDAKDCAWGLQETSYSDEVAYRLKMSLRLPDYGSVKIKLTLDRSGKVVKIETVQTQSAKNKAYVESKIPAIVFPLLGSAS